MEAPNMEMIASQVKAIREKQALSQVVLAGKAGLTLDKVTRLETAEQCPRPSTIRKLAKALGVGVEEIIGTGATEGEQDAPNLPAPAPSSGEISVTVAHLIPHRPPDFSTDPAQTLTIAGAKAGRDTLVEATKILRERLGVPKTDSPRGSVVLRALELYLALLRTATDHGCGEPEESSEGRYEGGSLLDNFAAMDEMARVRATDAGVSQDAALGRMLREQVAVQGVLTSLRIPRKPLLPRSREGQDG